MGVPPPEGGSEIRRGGVVYQSVKKEYEKIRENQQGKSCQKNVKKIRQPSIYLRSAWKKIIRHQRALSLNRSPTNYGLLRAAQKN